MGNSKAVAYSYGTGPEADAQEIIDAMNVAVASLIGYPVFFGTPEELVEDFKDAFDAGEGDNPIWRITIEKVETTI